jgi:hypothetical protein
LFAVSGPPLLVSTCWLSQLQYDWESPVWRHFLRDLGRFATVIRYDERGHRLSDWEIDDHSLEARVGDLEAVADDAGFDRFALMAISQGGPPAIEDSVFRRVFTSCSPTAPTSRSRSLEADDDRRHRHRHPEDREFARCAGRHSRRGWRPPTGNLCGRNER